MPIRKVFRYFPFLSQWEMNHLMVFPWLGYFSHFSKYAKKGTVMSYHQATIYSAELEDYVLLIHGQGWYDMYIQLPSLDIMNTWLQCFNQKKPDYMDFRRKPSKIDGEEETLQQTSSKSLDNSEHKLTSSLDILTHPHDISMLESGMSSDHLLRRPSDQYETGKKGHP
ncbi:hypothetical protein BDB01DRAFT_786934 [Pilobolus umbonatus]|nr:hypothetical protein BDB01DRAFT_786934 [Pilobolus umbonatus]